MFSAAHKANCCRSLICSSSNVTRYGTYIILHSCFYSHHSPIHQHLVLKKKWAITKETIQFHD
eukprot:jgi/Mesvir1/8002/Mv25518-RA.1